MSTAKAQISFYITSASLAQQTIICLSCLGPKIASVPFGCVVGRGTFAENNALLLGSISSAGFPDAMHEPRGLRASVNGGLAAIREKEEACQHSSMYNICTIAVTVRRADKPICYTGAKPSFFCSLNLFRGLDVRSCVSLVVNMPCFVRVPGLEPGMLSFAVHFIFAWVSIEFVACFVFAVLTCRRVRHQSRKERREHLSGRGWPPPLPSQ
eukprot:2124502-Amphidinium_carterae.1